MRVPSRDVVLSREPFAVEVRYPLIAGLDLNFEPLVLVDSKREPSLSHQTNNPNQQSGPGMRAGVSEGGSAE